MTRCDDRFERQCVDLFTMTENQIIGLYYHHANYYQCGKSLRTLCGSGKKGNFFYIYDPIIKKIPWPNLYHVTRNFEI